MKINKIIAISIIAIAVIVGIFLIISKKEVQLDIYSENVTTETDIPLYEIISNDNGSSYVKAGNIMIYLPVLYINIKNDSSSYWEYEYENIVRGVSITYSEHNKYTNDELKDTYFDVISKNYDDVTMSELEIKGKKYLCFKYKQDLFITTIIFTDEIYGKSGKNVYNITVSSDENNDDYIIQILSKTIHEGE